MNEETKKELKELSYKMMENEISKMQIKNTNSFSHMTGNKASNHSDDDICNRDILECDKMGYEISLKFNEILLKNGQDFNAWIDGPDAAEIAAEHLLYEYGLKYPISWYVEYEDNDGLHYGYYKSDVINRNHREFLQKLDNLPFKSNIKKRLLAAAEYYRSRRLLLSKYHNNEKFEEGYQPKHLK